MRKIGLLASAVLFGCSGTATGELGPLEHLAGRWVMVSVDDVEVVTPRPVFFQITGDVISGYDGCNDFAGDVDGIKTRLRACAEDVVTLPLDLNDPFSHLRKAVVSGDLLSLPAYEGTGVAIFERRSIEP